MAPRVKSILPEDVRQNKCVCGTHTTRQVRCHPNSWSSNRDAGPTSVGCARPRADSGNLRLHRLHRYARRRPGKEFEPAHRAILEFVAATECSPRLRHQPHVTISTWFGVTETFWQYTNNCQKHRPVSAEADRFADYAWIGTKASHPEAVAENDRRICRNVLVIQCREHAPQGCPHAKQGEKICGDHLSCEPFRATVGQRHRCATASAGGHVELDTGGRNVENVGITVGALCIASVTMLAARL